jgi:3-hydroxy-9,10-secoandrosta-1,3,5(10)-triene-9,17-dione monooxygenase
MNAVVKFPTVEERAYLSSDAIRARAGNLTADLRGRAAETERLRRLPAVNVDKMRQTGLFKVLQPRRYGGYQMSFRTQVDVVAEIARGCASTAWCLAVAHSHSWLAALLPEEAQDDLFGSDPDALVSAVVTSRGKAHVVDGGYIVSGFWPFCSGCQHSDWLLLGAVVVNEQNEPIDQGLLLLPTAEVEIKDDWNVMALRGTGSCSVVGKDLFVPRHRYLSWVAIMSGQAPGTDLHDGWLYRSAAVPVLMLVLAPAALGAAQGALEAFKERLPGRKVAYTNDEAQIEMSVTHVQVAEAATKIEVARLLLYHCADTVQESAKSGEMMDLTTRARMLMDCSYAIRQCLEAVESLFLACGGSGIAESNPIQRAARDIHAMSLHGAYNLQTNLESYGRVLVGLAPKTPMI